MHKVYIRSAELGAAFSDKPLQPMREQMVGAARRALHAAHIDASQINALFVAAMGSFEHEQFMGALPLWIANTLGLRADISPMLTGSSETGAWALRMAFQAMRHDDDWQHALVIAGEQMNPLAEHQALTPAEKLAERRKRNETIAQVVDETDRRYGLNMLRMSDLVMDVLAHAHDWQLEELTDLVLPFVALQKYRRVRRYPYGQFHHNTLERLAQHHARPRVTRHFRLDDVAPTTSGTVALVLSRTPIPGGRPIELVGMGQGYVPAGMTQRRGNPLALTSIRDAYRRACRDAGVNLQWLLDCDFAIVHDPFPPIEYAFLMELGLGPADIIKRMVSGWSNPYGGLKGCGHALGASGLLQVAKAFQTFTRSERYIVPYEVESPYPEMLAEQPFSTAFTTSVGGLMTNILVSLVTAGAPEHVPCGPVVFDESYNPEPATLRVLAATQLYRSAAFGDDITPITRHVHEPWVHLLEDLRGRQPVRTLAFAETRYCPGTAVDVEMVTFDDTQYQRIARAVSDAPSSTFTVVPVDEQRVRFLIELEERFHALQHGDQPLTFFAPRMLGSRYLCYATWPMRDGVQAEKARLAEPWADKAIGAAVHVYRFPSDAAGVWASHARWSARAGLRHPSLTRFIEVGRDGQDVFVVTEHVAGQAVASWLRDKPIAPRRVLRWALELTEAVASLHRIGQAHGHISADDVRVTPTGRLVLDEHLEVPTGALRDDVRGLGDVFAALLSGLPRARGDHEQSARLEALAHKAWGAGMLVVIAGCRDDGRYRSALEVLDALAPLAAAAEEEV